MQTYSEFRKQAADGDQTPWYNDVQNWMKENPNLTAGGAAALSAVPLYLLGRGFGKKRDRMLGLLTALLGGGAVFYGMQNWGVPWLTGLGQKAAPAAEPKQEATGQHLPTSSVGPRIGTSGPAPAKNQKPANKPVATSLKVQPASKPASAPAQVQQNTKPVVANGGGKRTPAYVQGITQFRKDLEGKYGPADKWKPELMNYYQDQATRFYNDPMYKMVVPGN